MSEHEHSTTQVNYEHLSFSEELDELLVKSDGKPLSLKLVELSLEGRGSAALMLLLSLPFTTPIPLPGLSVIFGIAIMYFALGWVVDKPTALPHFFHRHRVQFATLKKVVRVTQRVLKYCEKLFRGRLLFLLNGVPKRIAGLAVFSAAIALSLPIPPVIPFTNSFPAIAIILIALGVLEEDGLFVALGHVMHLFAWGYLIFWWEIVYAAISTVVGSLS